MNTLGFRKASNAKRRAKQRWPFIKKRVYPNGAAAWMVDARQIINGQLAGERKSFATQAEAETYQGQCRIDRANQGKAAFKLNERQRTEYADSCALLAPYKATVREAAQYYAQYLEATKNSGSVADAVKEFLKAKEQDGASKRYRADCRARLNRFGAAFPDKPLAAITAMDIDGFLRGLEVGIVTRNTFHRRLSALFAWAKPKYVKASPLVDVKKPREPKKRPATLTLDECVRLIGNTSEETRPFWLIAIFAGLRPVSELERLTWDRVDLEEKVILTPEGAKTPVRSVPIEDNLAVWLAPYAGRKGPVCPFMQKRKAKDTRAAGFGAPGTETMEERKAGVQLKPWIEDYTRHTYGSFHVARYGDIAKTATAMGNSVAIINSRYKDAKKPREAAAFWSISSPGKQKNTRKGKRT